MGLTLFYQAIPEHGSLFDRIKRERRIAFLFGFFFNDGGGPFFWATIREELENVLESVAEDHTGYESREELALGFEELLGEIEELRSAYPGIETRSAMFEKSHEEIRIPLAEAIGEDADSDETNLVDRLLHGESDLSHDGTHPLRLIPISTVNLGARKLRMIDIDALFPRAEQDYLREDFDRWSDMFLKASSRNEVVLVGR